MNYYVIHCHFYQPPRENPYTGVYMDNWNDIIANECYAKLARYTGSFSCNWGATLITWLKKYRPDVYVDVIRQIRKNKNAIFQPYYHAILPLLREEDAYLLLVWGIKDFLYRFNYYPLGVWLPELAVNSRVLNILESLGIEFFVAGQAQIEHDVLPGFYKVADCNIKVFVYNSEASWKVSFSDEHFFENNFIGYITENTGCCNKKPVIIATDGETFGHHKKKGALALTKLIKLKGKSKSLTETYKNELIKPFKAIKIKENSSWSCVHGVERWRSDCGCNTGMNPGWNQKWRTPLKMAVDWLNDKVDEIFYKVGEAIFYDPFKALRDYIHLYLNMDSKKDVEDFILKHIKGGEKDKVAIALRLCEMKRCALASYTSCGWFFDDISGLETRIILRFAARAIDLAYEVGGTFLEAGFIDILSKARSNISDIGSGADVYRSVGAEVRVDIKNIIKDTLIKRKTCSDSFALGYFLVYPDRIWYGHRDNITFSASKLCVYDRLFREYRYYIAIVVATYEKAFALVDKWTDDAAEFLDELGELFYCDIVRFFFNLYSKFHFSK